MWWLGLGARAGAEPARLQRVLRRRDVGADVGAATLGVVDLRSDILAADPRLGEHAFGLLDAGKRVAPESAGDGGVELEQELRLDLLFADQAIGHAGDAAARRAECFACPGIFFLHSGAAAVLDA